MTSRTLLRAGILLASSVSLVALSGCFDNVQTEFPDGLGPWSENDAPMPTPEGDDACPEEIAFGARDTYRGTNEAGGTYKANSMRARACIHQPAAVVWEALQDPLVGRDRATVESFAVIEPPNPEECDGLYQSAITAGSSIAPGFTVDFRLCWRMEVVEGTDDAPRLVAARWQKVWGSTALKVMEGSILAYPFPGDPSVTVVEYEYHLNSALDDGADFTTIQNYVTAIYGRLTDRAHGRLDD